MDRYWSPEISENKRFVVLDREQSHHLARVMRAEIGHRVHLLSGDGAEATAKVTSVKPTAVELEIEAVQRTAVRPQVRLCFAVVKGQALDFIFHRATELGVHSFQPLLTQNVVGKNAASAWNPERWQRVVRETCKQSQQPFFPEVHPLLSFEAFLKSRDASRVLLFCSEEDRDEEPKVGESAKAAEGIDLVIGPEGGWAEAEKQLALEHSARLLGLGVTRLRAESACLVAMTVAKVAIGEIPSAL